MNRFKQIGVKISFAWILGLLASSAQAATMTYTFAQFTNNPTTPPDIGNQFFLDVTDVSSTKILFTVRNEGPVASAIQQIAFDSGTLLASLDAIIENAPSVDFNANIQNLPGGATLTPPFNQTFGFVAASPPPQRGVNPGESVGFRFNLAGGQSFATINAALQSNALRVGMHVISIPNGTANNSNSFITTGVVPEPSSIAMVGIAGLAGLGLVIRRRMS